VFSPARYSSPPTLENHSGENPKLSVANTAWQTSVSLSVGWWNGFRTRRECPASEEIGTRTVDLGKSVVKTRGVQAPEVMRRRVQETGYC